MYLKLKQESSGYPSCFHNEADKTSTSSTTGAQTELLLTRHQFPKLGTKNFGQTKIELDVEKMGSKPETDPDNPCNFSEGFIRASNKSWY